jgi:tRNA dimethylallyltransferase
LEAKSKTVIIIAGPTAVGKTSVAIEVARHFGTEIISADSRQCFKELSIGVARPSEEELATVPHHFIASHSIHQKVTAATFEEYALEKIATLFQQQDVVVMVGGTGLYIKAFCEGMDLIPEVPQTVHDEVIAIFKEQGLPWLQEEIRKADLQFWEKGEIQNPQRMMRALEVVRATGQSIFHFRKGEKKRREFNAIKIALQLPKEVLHRNINHRVDKMMEEGLLAEVESLLSYQQLNALQTVGYKELFAYVNNEISLPGAIAAIKQNTRQYAKRQTTWFKKDKEYTWSGPNSEEVLKILQTKIT